MFYRTVYAATMLAVVHAQQQSKVIPSDLSAGFASSDVALQVSYTGDAVNGFTDGSTFSQQRTSLLSALGPLDLTPV